MENDLLAEIGWIRALAQQLVRDAAAADDVVQETLVAALERRPELAGPLEPWLATVLRRRVSLWRRGAARRREREASEARAEALPSAHELAARAEAQREVVDAVLALAEPYRSVVLLRYFEGLEPSEIARRRGIPAATVRSQLKRALDELRANLDGRHDGDASAWCLALLPLAGGRVLSKGALTSTVTATLAFLVMNTWLQVALGAALIAVLSFFFLRTERGAPVLPEELTSVGSTAPVDAASAPEFVAQAPSAHTERSELAMSESQAAPSVQHALAGRVIDAPTREPLVEYELGIENDDGSVERLVTDAHGRFASTIERNAGQHSFVLFDVPAPLNATLLNGDFMTWGESGWRDVAWDGASDVELATEAGPIYLLRFVAPAGLSSADFEAELFDSDPRTCPPETALLSQRTSIRGGAKPFARFAPSALGYRGLAAVRDAQLGSGRGARGPWTLRINSRDGLWSGQADVPAPAGVCAETIEIALTPAASVRLEFVNSLGVAFTGPALHITHGTPPRISQRSERAFSGDPLALELPALDPGSHRFAFRAEGMQAVDFQLELAPGERVVRTSIIQPLTVAAFVRGELTSRTGAFDEDVALTLTGPGGVARTVYVEWQKRGDQLVAPFAFDGLAAGEYHLGLFCLASRNARWSPEPGSVRAPSEGLVFQCDDGAPLQRVRFRVSAADDGQLLANANVTAFIGERILIANFDATPGEKSFDVYGGAELRWKVDAPGFVAQEGDSSSFSASGDELVQLVALERER